MNRVIRESVTKPCNLTTMPIQNPLYSHIYKYIHISLTFTVQPPPTSNNVIFIEFVLDESIRKSDSPH